MKDISKAVDKLFEVSFIQKVMCLEWLANIVMVKKANEKL
jgi:hypothetical protein